MPYIEINGNITDLELENIKTKEQFIIYMKYFFSLSDKTLTDKYKSHIKFKKKRYVLYQCRHLVIVLTRR